MKEKKLEILWLKGDKFLSIVGEYCVAYTYNWNTGILAVELENGGKLYNKLKDYAIKVRKK